MAMVQVDLSEYDMLREAKNKAEKRVKELEDEIKGLKDKSRVILTTKYVFPTIRMEQLVDDIQDLIRTESFLHKGGEIISPQRYRLQEKIYYALKSNIYFNNRTYDPNRGSYSSSQYIGFDDVKTMVENKYKKDTENAIKDYEETIESYRKLRKSVREDVEQEYFNEVNGLKTTINAKDKEIKDLKDQIIELSRSKEEKITELMNTINEAQAKLEEFTGPKKKGLFNKIFK